jgi:hypothetical protein
MEVEVYTTELFFEVIEDLAVSVVTVAFSACERYSEYLRFESSP